MAVSFWEPTAKLTAACFNVCTGEIEDAPGLDSLYKYKAEIKDGKIVVSAPEKELKSKVGRKIPRARNPSVASKTETVVIVGGGSGCIHTIESLRQVRFLLSPWALADG